MGKGKGVKSARLTGSDCAGLVGHSKDFGFYSERGGSSEDSERRKDMDTGYSEKKLLGSNKVNRKRLLQKSRQEKRVV